MKIGQFAKENHMTVDAIRHYMSMDLILPIKRSGQYEFDDRCQEDLQEVVYLKRLGFALSEIQSLMLIKRMAKHTAYERANFYRAFFERRLAWIDQERKRLKQMKRDIEKHLEQEVVLPPVPAEEGVPLQAMPLLCCAKCQSELIVEAGVLAQNQIISGEMVCQCGAHYTIESGIVCAAETTPPKRDYHELSVYLLDYVQETHYTYLSRIVHALEWVDRQIDFQFDVALELGTGSGFFLRYFLDQLPKDSIYIAVDYDYDRLIQLKRALSGIESKPNILYICADFQAMPLKAGIADLLVDYSGSSNFGFEHEAYLFNLTLPYLKKDAKWIGAFILFKNFVYGSRIPEKLRHQFTEQPILTALDAAGYKVEHMYETDVVTKGGRFEDYFLKGEAISSLMTTGRWG
ncbi:MerR family transcriptional regulator [Fusibacter paucivorans]|uniref:MerR family transcriptional regulator n=1 Tax=Fusibacter paucivorans TaxID=76009 RepID=A0ABS5PKZ8_9FIRM|nr:MerR family transcriptional regulator [Fusibacter paucivorans]MBS7525547.1 MerR family transcriptional regulator [Fusibacter paucivorans]